MKKIETITQTGFDQFVEALCQQGKRYRIVYDRFEHCSCGGEIVNSVCSVCGFYFVYIEDFIDCFESKIA